MQAWLHYRIQLPIILVTLFAMWIGTTRLAAQINHMAGDGMHLSARKAPANIVDIVRDPTDVPAPVAGRPSTVVHVTLTAKEVVGHLDPSSGSDYRYWTFNGKVPAPMIRVRQGDTVQVTLQNDATSHMAHSVDFHAALGPGGGAAFSEVVPGQSKTFSFQATTPGLFVYHCGTPMVAEHIANGMYGLILVEPPRGLAHVDHEYYVMQGELYTSKPKGTAGMQQFSGLKLIQETPEYFVFNGAVDALTNEYPLKAKVGQSVRIFFGDAGPNRPSALHVIGEIFTANYVAGSLTSPPQLGVQTASVAPGSAAILELEATTPGKFDFMDHAMSRMAKGLMGTIEVSGQPNLVLMHAGPASANAVQVNSAPVIGTTEADAAAAATTTEGAIGKGDADPADMAMGAAVTPMALPASRKARKPSQPALKSTSGTAAVLSKSPTEIAGCLNYQFHEVSLKAWRSGIVYRLQSQPLLFAEYANQLVYLTGHVGSVVPDRPSTPSDPSFVVDTLDLVAPNCDQPLTAALLRDVSAKEVTSTGASSGSVSVGMAEMAFLQPKITIKAGQTVVWKNTSHTPHDVVADPSKAMTRADVQLPTGVKPFGSALLQPGQKYSHVFTVPGTYRYVCTLHEGAGMKGQVIVK